MPSGGVTAPRQGWSSAPSVQGNVTFDDLMNQYGSQMTPGNWDATAHAAYASIQGTTNKFVSFTNEQACTDIVNYVKSISGGGVILWELGGGYLSSGYANRDRLLQAVKTAAGL